MTEESLFLAALEQHTPAERQAFLNEACGADAALRARVQMLLEADARVRGILDRPIPGGPEQTGAYIPGEQPGTIIAGRYKLLEAIGEGGMGTVWVAEQTQPVRRKVALKLIKAGMDTKSVLARFEAERQALAMMDHPNIAKVLDGGLTETGRPFFVMEYVKGVRITEYCDATRMSIPERLQLFAQVCQAVQHAHQKGIIHRDLKPSNILVAPYDDKPVPKVIDFGLAKAMHQALTERTLHTAHDSVLGTPLYMSPEQAQLNNLDVDTRSDIYSLGVLLYELLTGTTPLEKKRLKEAAWDEIRRIIREEEPPRPSKRLSSANTLPSLAVGRQTDPTRLTKLVRGELDWIVMKSLEKDRARRYETANGFAMDIQRYLAGEPVLAVPPSTRYRLRKFVRKHRVGLSAAAAIALLLVSGVSAVVAVQVRANRDLAAKNKELADEQAKVEKRFELAQKAIAKLHTGVSEDMLLKSDQFKEVRTQLLKEAADFYAELEKLLEGQSNVKSRRLLAEGYFQLATLTSQLGSRREALELHRKALGVRRELAAAPDADAPTRLDVARSLHAVGRLVLRSDPEGALNAFTEQQEIARMLAEEPSAPAVLGQSFINSALALWMLGRSADALVTAEKGLAIQRRLAGANPDFAEVQFELAHSLEIVENFFWESGKWAETLAILEESRAIAERLSRAHPGVTQYRYLLAIAHNNIGCTFFDEGKTADALVAQEKGRDQSRKLVESHPGVADFPRIFAVNLTNLGRALADLGKLADALVVQQQALPIFQRQAEAEHGNLMNQYYVALCYNELGQLLARMGKPAEALTYYEKARAVLGQPAEANLGFYRLPSELARSLENTALLLSKSGKSDEALVACRRALAIRQKVSDAQPTLAWLRNELAGSFLVLASVQHRAGQPAAAVASLRRALKLLEGLPTLTPRNHFTMACCHAQLAGVATDAGSGITAEQGTVEAEQAMTALRQAIAAGFDGIARLRSDTSLDTLWPREDFQKLIKELEAGMKSAPK